MNCENEECSNSHDGSFGSGRFCSRACSNKRVVTEDTKIKIKQSLVGKTSPLKGRQITNRSHICEKCGDAFYGYIRKGRKIHCDSCKRKPSVFNPKNILEISKRTITKILKRANKGCAICGWNESTCDIHHIVQQKDGGSDNNDNLIIVCPNHHRIIHTEKKYDKEYLLSMSISKIFVDWKKYYKG